MQFGTSSSRFYSILQPVRTFEYHAVRQNFYLLLTGGGWKFQIPSPFSSDTPPPEKIKPIRHHTCHGFRGEFQQTLLKIYVFPTSHIPHSLFRFSNLIFSVPYTNIPHPIFPILHRYSIPYILSCVPHSVFHMPI